MNATLLTSVAYKFKYILCRWLLWNYIVRRVRPTAQENCDICAVNKFFRFFMLTAHNAGHRTKKDEPQLCAANGPTMTWHLSASYFASLRELTVSVCIFIVRRYARRSWVPLFVALNLIELFWASRICLPPLGGNSAICIINRLRPCPSLLFIANRAKCPKLTHTLCYKIGKNHFI